MGKILLLVFYAASIVFFCGGCHMGLSKSMNETASNSEDNSDLTKPANTNSRKQTRSFPHIDQLAVQYGLVPLSKKSLEDGTWEVRLWSSIDIDYEKCLILTNVKKELTGTLITPKLEYGKDVPTSPKRIPTDARNISNIRDISRSVERLLNEFKISAPLIYSIETDRSAPILDEGVITIEVLNGQAYDVVSYRAFTKHDDGLQVIKFCKSMESELNVRIGCEH